MTAPEENIDLLPHPRPARMPHEGLKLALRVFLVFALFAAGFGSGYLAGSHAESNAAARTESDNVSRMSALMAEVNPPDGYRIPAVFGDVGPALLVSGGIDYAAFVALYEQAGRPLDESQLAILTSDIDEPVVIRADNAHFLLNFFWALGLTNQNPMLTEGPMMEYGQGQIGNFASTGGWTLGAKPADELFASTLILPLTEAQLARLVEVASMVYRPCCDNSTHFPDCNHGMAMLGLLELMASQDASVDEMFVAAKYVSAFWFPQQMMETAIYLGAAQNASFREADARQVVGQMAFSATGFRTVHQWLSEHGLLQQIPGAGGSCGVQ